MEGTNRSMKQVDESNEKSLKGTLISVGFVGAVIVIMWVAVFSLYMSRI
ncbi:cytochrome c oxidase subunit 2A [Virgibacillus ndiopensis]